MSEKTDSVKQLIDSLSASELESLTAYLRSKLPQHPLEEKWAINSNLILDAIFRSQDIIQRGIRGVIAEAVFEAQILPALPGWHPVRLVGDLPYDFAIRRETDDREVRIQVKLQRTERGKPLIRGIYGPDKFIVEVQKTRSGTKRKPKQGVSTETAPTAPEQTRPYQFGDFDILAVNTQPSTGEWTRFMYTVADWLIPRAGNKNLIEIMQPVSAKRSDVWTDDMGECIRWLLSGEKRVIFDIQAAKQTLLEKHRAKKKPQK